MVKGTIFGEAVGATTVTITTSAPIREPSNEHSKRPSATKRGPGRYHQPGAQKASPIKDKGAPRGFVLHQASAAKTDRKLLIALHGRRQWLRMSKEMRRAEAA